MSPPPVFALADVTKIYRMGEVDVHALRGISMTIASGEFIVLLGPSGSGKSTLLNIVGGLDTPTAGRVHYRERDLTTADEAALTDYRRHYVGFVFQFYNLIPSLTARENVALVTDIVRTPMKPEDALDLVGLTPRRDHFPSQLSGGEQQRVAIARAVVMNPALLLADEPTGNLDSASGREIVSLIERMNEKGLTLVVVTHDAGIGGRARRRIRLSDGLITSDDRSP